MPTVSMLALLMVVVGSPGDDDDERFRVLYRVFRT